MGSQTKQVTKPPGTVQDFYERYPYPPPVDSLDKYRERWMSRDRRRADYHLLWPSKRFREDHSILIAGCGTSQAAKHAMKWPDAHVTGIDFSATSVESTNALKKKYGLKNLELRELPVERVGELEDTFDQIVCTGVLHHLSNPDVGLKALRSVLKPDGALHLMVYAPYGRTGIYLLQEFCRRVGIVATRDGIRDLIEALDYLPPGHPLTTLLNEAPDFHHDAAIADALLHPQDRAYSVPQLFEFLRKCGMTFGRWLKQAPYSSQCGAIAQLPQARQLAGLSAADQYAAIELFRGAMNTHSVVAFRDDAPTHPYVTDLPLKHYVPIRSADTICVKERLPAGAAAVLINPGHTFRDIFLPITSEEERLFNGIDGRRTIGEIVDGLPASSEVNGKLDAVTTFFNRLWLYDQVVFDSSLADVAA